MNNVKKDLFRLSSKRLLTTTIVISIIQHVIDTDRENLLKTIPDVQFNPMNDSTIF
jgi:hypothetical protein